MRDIDIEELNHKFDDLISQKFKMPDEQDIQRLKPLVEELCSLQYKLKAGQWKELKSKHKYAGKNSFLNEVFNRLVARGELVVDDQVHSLFREQLKIKECKSTSGVLVITVFTSPYPEYVDPITGEHKVQTFSCAWNCAYCPNEPGQPRSYLKGEPGVLRANKNKFDCVLQMSDRMRGLYNIGHPIDKLEIIVLGGTWTSYPIPYREQFCRDIYYAANTFWDPEKRKPLDIEEEKRINQTARTKVIGLTLETRPDTINIDEIRRLRKYGCTRVQLGIQHLDKDVLEKISRRCDPEKTREAIRMLKDCGFKVDSHWMPNLPGSNVKKDEEMLVDRLLGLKHPVPKRYVQEGDVYEEYSLVDPDFQTDQWKVYPCAIVPWTDIETWYKDGSYVPYEEAQLVKMLIKMKTLVFPWIRLNRIIRDIPADYIIASSDRANLRQELLALMEKDGTCCNCIRCREVKKTEWDGDFVCVVRTYDASGGVEYFISAESRDLKRLYGFLRLRLCNARSDIFPELKGCALIRELHVYGKLMETCRQNKQHVQHCGIGKFLLGKAKQIAKEKGFQKCAVIAGEGTKKYYERIGFDDIGCFMIDNSSF